MKAKQVQPKKPMAKPQPAKQPAKSQFITQESSLSYRKGLYITLGLLAVLALFVFRDFVFLNKVFLYKDIGSDSINIGLPQVFHISDYLHNLGGVPKWSFYQGMGQNYLGYLSADPFSLLLYFANPDNIVFIIGLIEALKFLTAGILFYLYLRQLKVTTYTAIIGATCFAFCGFIVLGSCWWIFSSEACFIAFLLFSIEKLIQKKWYYFPFAIALIGVSTPFNLFIYAIVTIVYLFVRLYNQYGWNKKMIPVYGQVVGLGLLGGGISSFILLNKAQLMLDSPRVSGSSSYFADLMNTGLFQTDGLLENLTKIGRLFSSDMLGTGNYFVGAENYLEAPLFYVGLLSLLLFTQFFPFLSKRKKWVFGIVFLCALLPFIFPFFRYALWLFSGKYYRGLSFLFGLVLLIYGLLSLNYIDTIRKINYKVLFGTLGILLILLFMPNILGKKGLFQADLQTFCTAFLLIYTFLICLLPVKSVARYIKPVLVVFVFIEMAFMANITINKRTYIEGYMQNGAPVQKNALMTYGEGKGKVGYNDYSTDAVQYIHNIDTSFYRIQKTYGSGLAIHKSLNDPLMQRFYGTSSYSSFNQSNYVKFLLATVIPEGSNEWSTRWLDGLQADRPLLQIFGNVHYNLSKVSLPEQLMAFNEQINQIEDVYIYKSRFALPFGYTYSHYIPRSSFDSLAFKDITFLEAAVVADDEIGKYASSLSKLEQPVSPDRYGLTELLNDVSELKQESLKTTYFSQNNIKGTITVSADKLLFFTIPFDKNWKAYDNGEEIPIELVNIGFSGILLHQGEHLIELRFEPSIYYPSLAISLISLLIVLLLIGWFCWGKQRFCSKQKPTNQPELQE